MASLAILLISLLLLVVFCEINFFSNKLNSFGVERYSNQFWDFNVIKDGIAIDDISQGNLKDDYLISAISAVSEFPERILRILLQRTISPTCGYCIALCITGVFQEFYLDDKFYYIADEEGEFSSFAFAKSQDHELWTCLVEKAFAKAYGSYMSISIGEGHEALFDLTGAPSNKMEFAKVNVENGKLKNGTAVSDSEAILIFDRILKYDEKDYIMTARSRPEGNRYDNEGIEPGH